MVIETLKTFEVPKTIRTEKQVEDKLVHHLMSSTKIFGNAPFVAFGDELKW